MVERLPAKMRADDRELVRAVAATAGVRYERVERRLAVEPGGDTGDARVGTRPPDQAQPGRQPVGARRTRHGDPTEVEQVHERREGTEPRVDTDRIGGDLGDGREHRRGREREHVDVRPDGVRRPGERGEAVPTLVRLDRGALARAQHDGGDDRIDTGVAAVRLQERAEMSGSRR